MEQNFWNVIHDISILSELAVLLLYAQSISHPYIEKDCTPEQNSLELGPYHAKVLDHIGKIISNPCLLIGASPSFTTAALWKEAGASNTQETKNYKELSIFEKQN
jgi:hypothetical protein